MIAYPERCLGKREHKKCAAKIRNNAGARRSSLVFFFYNKQEEQGLANRKATISTFSTLFLPLSKGLLLVDLSFHFNRRKMFKSTTARIFTR